MGVERHASGDRGRERADRELIESFDPEAVPSMQRAQAAILELLRETQAPRSRSQFEPGHLTASAIVLSPAADALLLVHHKRLDRWLQPGGHIESADASLAAAARREVLEETAADLDPQWQAPLVGLDVHEIPAARGEPTHLHHDVLFFFRARSLVKHVSDESNAVLWAPIDEFERYEPDPPLLHILERVRSHYEH